MLILGIWNLPVCPGFVHGSFSNCLNLTHTVYSPWWDKTLGVGVGGVTLVDFCLFVTHNPVLLHTGDWFLVNGDHFTAQSALPNKSPLPPHTHTNTYTHTQVAATPLQGATCSSAETIYTPGTASEATRRPTNDLPIAERQWHSFHRCYVERGKLRFVEG